MNAHLAQTEKEAKWLKPVKNVRCSVTNIGDYQPYVASVVCVCDIAGVPK